MNRKTILLIICLVGIAFYIAYPKIHLYFLAENRTGYMVARSELYAASFDIAKNYFPLGSGFGSFGSYASVKFLSPLYEQYDLYEVLNLQYLKGSYASDAFYATLLGQFGIMGPILFLCFFIWILRLSLRDFSPRKNYFTLLNILFFAIESFSDSTFTQHTGFFIMILLGYILSQPEEKPETLRTL